MTKSKKQREQTWCDRRVCIVMSDAWHTLHTLNLIAPVRLLNPSAAGEELPVIEAPIDAIVEKAQKHAPDFCEGRDVVGVLCAAWDMSNKGTIVWLTPSKKQEVEKGADHIV